MECDMDMDGLITLTDMEDEWCTICMLNTMCDGIAQRGRCYLRGGLVTCVSCLGLGLGPRSARGRLSYSGIAGHHYRFLLHSSIPPYYDIAPIQANLRHNR